MGSSIFIIICMEAYNYSYSIPYIIFFSIILFFFFIESRNINKGKSDNPIQIIVFILLLIFIGLRGFVYSDWIAYYQVFEYLPTLWSSNQINFSDAMFEPGFLFFSILIKSIYPDYHFFIFINALIDLSILCLLFRKYSKYFVLSVLLFLVVNGLDMEFNLLRNSKAIILFLLSLRYLQQKRLVPYLLLNILGMTFHVSALIFIPLYFVLNREIPKIFIWLIFVAGNLIFLLKIKWISSLLPIISLLNSAIISGKSEIYMDSANAYGLSIGYLERILTFVIFTLFYNKYTEKNSMNKIFYNIYLFYFIFMFYFSEIEVFAGRLSQLFIFSYWFLYPNLYNVLLTVKKKMLFMYLFIIYSILRIMQTNNNIFSKYDNIIWGIETFQERKATFNKYSSTLFD